MLRLIPYSWSTIISQDKFFSSKIVFVVNSYPAQFHQISMKSTPGPSLAPFPPFSPSSIAPPSLFATNTSLFLRTRTHHLLSRISDTDSFLNNDIGELERLIVQEQEIVQSARYVFKKPKGRKLLRKTVVLDIVFNNKNCRGEKEIFSEEVRIFLTKGSCPLSFCIYL